MASSACRLRRAVSRSAAVACAAVRLASTMRRRRPQRSASYDASSGTTMSVNGSWNVATARFAEDRAVLAEGAAVTCGARAADEGARLRELGFGNLQRLIRDVD